MDGIDRITARIKSDADNESAAVLAKAKREAEEMIKHYDEEIKKQVDETIRHGAAQADQWLRRLEGVAELEADKNLLATKQELINAAFNRAAEFIAAFPKEKYIEFLSKLAVQHSRTGMEQILLSKRDLSNGYGEKVLSDANAALAAAGKPADLSLGLAVEIDGGLILKDGNVEVNCAIGTILRFMRDRISGEVAEILFN